MLRLAEPQRRDLPGESNATFYEPRGVAVVIAPWNFPLAILTGMTAAALVTGNTAVMKPAEQSPIVAAKLMEVFEEAGFPPGVVNYLPGVGEEVGPALVSHPDVSMIAFTGSRAVGLSIQRDASVVHEAKGQDHIKRVITELGGKNAVIVDEDADLDEAVHGVVASAFGYSGQKCSACSRAVVLAGVYDAFLARLVEATRSLKVGPADDPAYSVGPVIDDEARRRIEGAIERGKSEAKLVYGADVTALANEGCYVGPTVFADVPPGAKLAQEEIFGPVLAVIPYESRDEAIRIANESIYGLQANIMCSSTKDGLDLARRIRSGAVGINGAMDGIHAPRGGFKQSGIGREIGKWALDDYLEYQAVTYPL